MDIMNNLKDFFSDKDGAAHVAMMRATGSDKKTNRNDFVVVAMFGVVLAGLAIRDTFAINAAVPAPAPVTPAACGVSPPVTASKAAMCPVTPRPHRALTRSLHV